MPKSADNRKTLRGRFKLYFVVGASMTLGLAVLFPPVAATLAIITAALTLIAFVMGNRNLISSVFNETANKAKEGIKSIKVELSWALAIAGVLALTILPAAGLFVFPLAAAIALPLAAGLMLYMGLGGNFDQIIKNITNAVNTTANAINTLALIGLFLLVVASPVAIPFLASSLPFALACIGAAVYVVAYDREARSSVASGSKNMATRAAKLAMGLRAVTKKAAADLKNSINKYQEKKAEARKEKAAQAKRAASIEMAAAQHQETAQASTGAAATSTGAAATSTDAAAASTDAAQPAASPTSPDVPTHDPVVPDTTEEGEEKLSQESDNDATAAAPEAAAQEPAAANTAAGAAAPEAAATELTKEQEKISEFLKKRWDNRSKLTEDMRRMTNGIFKDRPAMLGMLLFHPDKNGEQTAEATEAWNTFNVLPDDEKAAIINNAKKAAEEATAAQPAAAKPAAETEATNDDAANANTADSAANPEATGTQEPVAPAQQEEEKPAAAEAETEAEPAADPTAKEAEANRQQQIASDRELAETMQTEEENEVDAPARPPSAEGEKLKQAVGQANDYQMARELHEQHLNGNPADPAAADVNSGQEAAAEEPAAETADPEAAAEEPADPEAAAEEPAAETADPEAAAEEPAAETADPEAVTEAEKPAAAGQEATGTQNNISQVPGFPADDNTTNAAIMTAPKFSNDETSAIDLEEATQPSACG